jgi:hypothetical protein
MICTDLADGLAHRVFPATGAHLPSPTVVQESTFLGLDEAAATCLIARMTLWLIVVI